MAISEELSTDPDEFITFASTSKAQLGFQFLHRGHLPACEKCQFFFVCQKPLEKYQMYEVVEVRPKQHQCPNGFHEDAMQVVKVHKLAKRIAMPRKGTFGGVTTVYKHQFCYAFECPHRQECISTVIITPGAKIKIRDIVKEITQDCKMGYQLVLVDYSIMK